MDNSKIVLEDFLSDYVDKEKVVEIILEPSKIYFSEERDANYLNFDFLIRGLTNKNLIIKFIKVAVYDENNQILSFQYLNHNAAETPSMHTIGKYLINGKEEYDIYNPFYRFPKDIKINKLRYMFTFYEKETNKEYYYGNIIVIPIFYKQKAKLAIPIHGLMTIIDGYDYYSHHRRFGMTVVRKYTEKQFNSNFSRFGLDFVLIGKDGNLQKMKDDEKHKIYDFHFSDVKNFYNHDASVYSPSDGIIVDLQNSLEDLYNKPFDFEKFVKEKKVKDMAGNYIIIKHNENEYSHLFHLKQNSVLVKIGDTVKRNQKIGTVGFSGTATTYSHLHYQLMDGKDFLNDNALPCKFSDFILVNGSKNISKEEEAINTGDFTYYNE